MVTRSTYFRIVGKDFALSVTCGKTCIPASAWGSRPKIHYDGRTFTNFTRKFVGHIIEDKKGNIWTSSESANSPASVESETGNIQPWAISRYDGASLFNKRPTVTEITNKGMIFGILEDDKGSIWFGAFDGVHRYDGKTITDFKGK